MIIPIKQRYLAQYIQQDLVNKMVFIGGPRQVGKTTLAKNLGKKHYQQTLYLNWDAVNDRKIILQASFPGQTDLIIFDELHKYRQWKNHIKGIYDTKPDGLNIIVTGSARLDIYRKGDDSLFGRYFNYRLHPFSLAELLQHKATYTIGNELSFDYTNAKHRRELFDQLWQFSGFPEPLFQQDDITIRRWRNQRLDRLIKEDIRDIELIRDLSAMQVLVELLPKRVGSPLSLNALREDVNVAHKTISLWVDILERFYYHFRLPLFSHQRIKSLRKEKKLYLYDWSEINNPAIRLENIVATHLLKFCHFLYDVEGYKAELFYVRDIEGREIDFLVAVDNKPWFAVEVKEKQTSLSSHLKYFADKLQIPQLYQVVNTPGVDFIQHKVRVMSVDLFLSGLI